MAQQSKDVTKATVTVRPERPKDLTDISEVNRIAFGRDVEAKLVEALRNSKAFIPDLSLVAIKGSEVVGHILFNPIKIRSGGKSMNALALAPLAVRPQQQNTGIGSLLVQRGLVRCREMGHKIVVVIGHPTYYPRFGFTQAMPRGLNVTFEVPSEAFLVLELVPGALDGVHGVVEYPPEFDGL